jgi:RimJ/RimL family protein N-acetyltransferase
MDNLTLAPLESVLHSELLQAVYDASPDYWEMYDISALSRRQALRDLQQAERTPGRTLLGILLPASPPSGEYRAEMVGCIDIRLHFPAGNVVAVGMIMVAMPHRRKGIAREAWNLIEAWLASSAQMQSAQARVEQFNIPAMRFFSAVGFTMTGEAERTQVGDKFVRLLTMEKPIAASA